MAVGSSNSPAQKEQGGRGLVAEKQSASTKNLLSVVWPAQPPPRSAAQCSFEAAGTARFIPGDSEVFQRLWAEAGDSLTVHQPAHCAPYTVLESQCS